MPVLAKARLDLSSPVTLVVEGRRIIIEAAAGAVRRRLQLPFSEADLVRDLDPQTAHADELALPGAAELGGE